MNLVNDFSQGEAISFGWKAAKKYFWFFFFTTIVYSIVSFLLSSLNQIAFESIPTMGIVVRLFLDIFLSLLLGIFLIKMSLQVVNSDTIKLKENFVSLTLVLRFFGATVVYSVIVGFGLLLFVIPGIIWAMKFQFYPYFILEQGLDIKTAFKKSALITNNLKFKLFLFRLTLGFCAILPIAIIVVVGATLYAFLFSFNLMMSVAVVLLLIVGLILSFIVNTISLIAPAFVYHKLSSSTQIDPELQPVQLDQDLVNEVASDTNFKSNDVPEEMKEIV